MLQKMVNVKIVIIQLLMVNKYSSMVNSAYRNAQIQIMNATDVVMFILVSVLAVNVPKTGGEKTHVTTNAQNTVQKALILV